MSVHSWGVLSSVGRPRARMFQRGIDRGCPGPEWHDPVVVATFGASECGMTDASISLEQDKSVGAVAAGLMPTCNNGSRGPTGFRIDPGRATRGDESHGETNPFWW